MGSFKSQSEDDKFFTPLNEVKLILNSLDLYNFSTIIEPSAGAGAFSNTIREMGFTCLAYDIKPDALDIIKADFLKTTFSWHWEEGKTLVVGNPPYGRRGKLAIDFINKCHIEGADTIAFVLPRSFKRDSLKNRVPLCYHLEEEWDLNEFKLPSGEMCNINSVFQKWVKQSKNRKIISKPKTHPDFEMKHIHFTLDKPEVIKKVLNDFEFGIGKSTLKIKLAKDFNKGSVWFIKPNVPGVLDVFKKCIFDKARESTRIPTLAKGEIIEEYIKFKK